MMICVLKKLFLLLSMLKTVVLLIGMLIPIITEQHIIIISDRSCDTEDCSNEAENSTLHHSNK